MTTNRVMKSDVTASVNPMSTLRIRTSDHRRAKDKFTAPVKEDTELENSDSNHLSQNILVHGESRLLAFLVAITFNV